MEKNTVVTRPPQVAGQKILVHIGLDYVADGSFWYREAGLLVRSLRELGADAWLVAFGEDHQSQDEHKALITTPRQRLEDPSWWQSHKAYAIVLMLWGAGRFEGIRRAAVQATPRVMEKLDTDGVRSPRIWFGEYLLSNWMFMRDRGTPALLAPPLALGRTLLVHAFPNLLDRKLTSGLAKVPVVAAESPIAVERIRRWIHSAGFAAPRMACIHHPVDQTDIGFNPAIEKQNRIVSVGRWESKQKNLPLMLKVLQDFLALRPDWSADLVGRVPADLDRQMGRLSPGVRERLRCRGPLPHAQVAQFYQAAKIYLMTSRHEAFCNAASEALCSGCSIVGPADTAGLPFVAGYASGTVACRKSAPHLLDALGAEVAAWQAGWRDPRQISETWTQRVSGRAVARKILEVFSDVR